MAEILFMKSLNLLITIICYSGTGIIFIDSQLEGVISDALKINPVLQKIILHLLIVLWVIKIIWYVVDKVIQVKERLDKFK